MSNIQVLDCTLRDGGYVNEWAFGDKNAQEIARLISQTGVDYFEVGFIKLCDYVKDIIQFNQMEQVTRLFKPTKQKLSMIVEVGYGYPVTSFPDRSEDTVDLVRVIMWKRMLKEGLEYCKELKKRGYEVGVQATRTEQYSLEEFAELIEMFNEVNPKAIYIVDTFGLLTKDHLFEYARIADEHLGDGIRLGYHAHNNLQQAFSNAQAMCEENWKHDIMLDASVLGMGRGAGNLCLELLLKYLNETRGCNYSIEQLYEVADKYLMKFYQESPWGYSMPYFLSAMNGRNPSFVHYLEHKGLSIQQISTVFSLMKERNVGITFDTKMCDGIIEEVTLD